MILALAPECPLFHPENEAHVASLLYEVLQGHLVLARPDPEALQTLLPAHLWATYNAYLKASFSLAASTSSTVHFPDCGNCDPQIVVNYARSAPILIVENATTDGGFVQALARAFRRRVAGKLSGLKATLDIRTAGGIGEIRKEVDRIASSHIPPGSKRRILVLTDSDSRYPGHISADAQRAQNVALEKNCRSFILSRRSIENYVPRETIRDYHSGNPEMAPVVGTIVGLTETQYAHYPMKSGLRNPLLAPEEADLYLDTPPRRGLGDDWMKSLLTTHHLEEHLPRSHPDVKTEAELLLDELEGIL